MANRRISAVRVYVETKRPNSKRLSALRVYVEIGPQEAPASTVKYGPRAQMM